MSTTWLKQAVMRFLLVLRDATSFFSRTPEVAILCYHSISDVAVDTAVSPTAFAAQLRMLAQSGGQFVSLAQIVAWVSGEGTIPQRAIAITFDDGYADFETNALPLLRQYQVPATVFIVGNEEAARPRFANDIPLMSSDALQRLHENPTIEIGYHSTTHPNLARYATDSLADEVRSPFSARFFAYPGGNHNPEVATAVRGAGYIAACTIGWNLVRQGTDMMYLPRSVITHDMPLWRVRFATTRALRWYRVFSRLLK